MPIAPTPSATERFATILRCLTQAVAARTGWSLTLQLIGLIVDRIRGIKQRVARLAARIGDGTYAPRPFAHRRPPAEPRPRAPNKLPQKFGWLLGLLPEAVGHRSQLESLLRDPEMAALLAAAPASLARPLRSLCWMLRVSPPEILARPAKPRQPRKKPPPAAAEAPEAPEAPPPPRPQPPEWLRTMRRSLPQWSLAPIRGQPHRP